YGFPEMAEVQRKIIREGKRITNPGCYPTGAIALLRPLARAHIIPHDWPVTINAVSGYSGGGKAMIAEFEDASLPNHSKEAFRIYALGLEHKHVPELEQYSLLSQRPLFAPSVGRYAQGMIVEVPLQLWALPSKPSLEHVHATIAKAYEGE